MYRSRGVWSVEFAMYYLGNSPRNWWMKWKNFGQTLRVVHKSPIWGSGRKLWGIRKSGSKICSWRFSSRFAREKKSEVFVGGRFVRSRFDSCEVESWNQKEESHVGGRSGMKMLFFHWPSFELRWRSEGWLTTECELSMKVWRLAICGKRRSPMKVMEAAICEKWFGDKGIPGPSRLLHPMCGSIIWPQKPQVSHPHKKQPRPLFPWTQSLYCSYADTSRTDSYWMVENIAVSIISYKPFHVQDRLFLL